MTTPESIVTSLDWSKKLKVAGWPQDEANYWWLFGSQISLRDCSLVNRDSFPNTAAPTAEEILRRLPMQVTGTEIFYFWCNADADGQWRVGYDNDGRALVCKTETTLANAAAAMYCYLAEQKLLPKP